jgi:TatD DNase family protein
MPYPTGQQYIDLHTHIAWNYPHIFGIRSLVKPQELETFRDLTTPVSVGLHPWFIDLQSNDQVIALVREAAALPHILAIGECGIDLKKDTPFALQEKVFLEQAAIAEEVNKPLVIHCVRAYQQLSNLLRQLKPTVPWIFHGYNHNGQVAQELIRQGAYLSIGADFLKENSKIRKSLPALPLDHIFFETDEWQQPVWKLYAEVARLISIPEKELKLQVFENFRICFPKTLENV